VAVRGKSIAALVLAAGASTFWGWRYVQNYQILKAQAANEQNRATLQRLVEDWKREVRNAESTPRIALGASVLRLSDLQAAIQRVPSEPCTDPHRAVLNIATQATVEGFRVFLASGEKLDATRVHADVAYPAMEKFEAGVAQCFPTFGGGS
jgi:hypothetical protein